MSRERKRGSLETLLKLIDGRPVEDSFAYASLPLESLKGQYRYVITLDSDTILPPGSALRLVGSMLHPLQKRQKLQGRMRGVSVLQPRMEIAAHTVGSRLSLLLGGRGGADPYNALTADLAQDLYRRGTFMGKGIIDPAPFLDATERAVLPGCVLSHDLLEGELAGCAMASDITLYDGHPKTLKGFLYRLHRWTRGDWQLLAYVLPLFPRQWRPPRRALDAAGRRKIWHNLLRSLVAPMRVLLIAYAAFAGRTWLLLGALLLPELPYALPAGLRGLPALLARLAVLPCEAGMQADAIARTLYRLWFSRRSLLAWTTAAQLSRPSDKPPMLFFYLSMVTGAAVAGLSLLPGGTPAGLATGALWVAFPFALPWLEQPVTRPPRPTGYMREVLTRVAKGTLTFFETAMTDADHGLPPDNVQIEPNKGVSHRTSPTNIGLYLCALAAAERLRLLAPDEMARRMEDTLATLEALPKWQGHLYNWYDTRTLEPLEPPFISSVDSGNLAACLLTCAQGVRVLLPQLSACYHSLAARMDALAEGMRFTALFDAEAELFRIGVHPLEESPSTGHYDLLASESRLLSFVAIMLGQSPVRHWWRLGRLYTRVRGAGQTLISYNGTMFEYLMPLLFQPTVPLTLLDGVCRAAVKAQARCRRGGVFGVSESGYYAFDPNLYYLYKAFGLPRLSLDPDQRSDVIAPYATFLANANGSQVRVSKPAAPYVAGHGRAAGHVRGRRFFACAHGRPAHAHRAQPYGAPSGDDSAGGVQRVGRRLHLRPVLLPAAGAGLPAAAGRKALSSPRAHPPSAPAHGARDAPLRRSGPACGRADALSHRRAPSARGRNHLDDRRPGRRLFEPQRRDAHPVFGMLPPAQRHALLPAGFAERRLLECHGPRPYPVGQL